MKRLPRWLQIGFGLCFLQVALSAEFVPLDPDALSPLWKRRLEAIRAEEPASAHFQEVRRNRFLRGDRVFSGRLRLDPGRGISLAYESPIEVTLVITPGILWRRGGDGEWTSFQPPENASLGDWQALLWNFLPQELGTRFELFGEVGERDDSWKLRLEPKAGQPLPEIEIETAKGTPRTVTLAPQPHRTTVFTLSEVALSPQDPNWESAFPPR